MKQEQSLPDRVADLEIIKRHKPDGLKIEEGVDTILFDVEKIVFKKISKCPWFAQSDNILGTVEFYGGNRCFSITRDSGFPNYSQELIEKGKKSGKAYYVKIAGYELSRIYDDSRDL